MAMMMPSGENRMNNEVVIYQTESGSKITLSPQIVRQYLVNGQGNVTDQEVTMFLQLCKYQGLNPFLRECYLIKYGDKAPATIVTGKEVFTKRAERHPQYRGQEAGIYTVNTDGKVRESKGTIVLPNERVIGGWAKIYREGYQVPIEYTVSFDEYAGRKQDGTLNQQWATKPATMIRKCALVAALREAFPSEFGGLYDAVEINTIESEQLPQNDITPADGIIQQMPIDDNEQQQSQQQPPKMGGIDETAATVEVISMGGHKCAECGKVITDKIASYSKSVHGRALCMLHQRQ